LPETNDPHFRLPKLRRQLFEKALSISPDNARAAEGLKKIKDIRKRGKKK